MLHITFKFKQGERVKTKRWKEKEWECGLVLCRSTWRCLHNLPVCRSVPTAPGGHGKKRPHFSRVEWRNEAIVRSTGWPRFHLITLIRVQISQSHGNLMGSWLKVSKLFCTLFCLWDANVLLFVVVEVARVSRSSALRQEGRFNLKKYKRRTCRRSLAAWIEKHTNICRTKVPFAHRWLSSLLKRTTYGFLCH